MSNTSAEAGKKKINKHKGISSNCYCLANGDGVVCRCVATYSNISKRSLTWRQNSWKWRVRRPVRYRLDIRTGMAVLLIESPPIIKSMESEDTVIRTDRQTRREREKGWGLKSAGTKVKLVRQMIPYRSHESCNWLARFPAASLNSWPHADATALMLPTAVISYTRCVAVRCLREFCTRHTVQTLSWACHIVNKSYFSYFLKE